VITAGNLRASLHERNSGVVRLSTLYPTWRFPLRISMCRMVQGLLFLLFTTITCYAQYSGNVQGIVTDPSDAAIPNASVHLRNTDTSIEQTASTGGSGFYRFNSLPPGNYVVSASASNFGTKEAGFTLSTAETKSINLGLPLTSAAMRNDVMPVSTTLCVTFHVLAFTSKRSWSYVESTATVPEAGPLSNTTTCHPPATGFVDCTVLTGVMPGSGSADPSTFASDARTL
jgi:hypothetical protein